MNESAQNMAQRIAAIVAEDLEKLPPGTRAWVERHLVEPRRVTLALDERGERHGEFRLVTDHSGSEDSSSRIVFDERTGMFGLATTLEDGTEWFMGPCGGLADTVQAM